MNTVKYYHGGFGELKVGQLVLPPAMTGAPSTASYGASAVCRRDRVYVTTLLFAAYEFACLHWTGKGKVYEVEPVGELTSDPDAIGDHSFECARACVVRVHRVRGKMIKAIQKQARAA